MKKIFKVFGIILIVLVTTVGIAVAVVMQKTNTAIVEKPALEFRTFEFSSDATAIARGEHLYASRGCVDCHGDNGAGKLVFEAPPMGRYSGSNLTLSAETYTDKDWIRAIRFALGADGRKLIFMPSHEFTHFSDEDVNDLAAYIRRMPKVDTPSDPIEIGLLARVLYLKGDFPLLPFDWVEPSLADQAAPQTGPTVAYGDYLLRGCIGCHGNQLSGGKIPGTPPDWVPAANITPHGTGMKAWTFEDFQTAVSTGTKPDGTQIDKIMPLGALQAMHDWEIEAIWLALREKPAIEFGNR